MPQFFQLTIPSIPSKQLSYFSRLDPFRAGLVTPQSTVPVSTKETKLERAAF